MCIDCGAGTRSADIRRAAAYAPHRPVLIKHPGSAGAMTTACQISTPNCDPVIGTTGERLP